MAEIKISDLSIGDWVQTVDCDARQNKCCVVEGIEKWRPDYVVVLKYEDGSIETLGRKCIEPIPLTPEILKKNGWVQRDQWNWRNPHIKCSCCRYGRKYWDIHIYGKGRKYRPTRITIENILHTHQLQHALRLACVGKEIEV